MTSIIFFFIFIPILSIILLSVNFIFAPHKPYKEKKTPFECGYHSFLSQNRTQFTISFFIFALLFLIFDLEIVLIYPYSVSSYANNIYGLTVMIIFTLILTVGFIFELGKNALKIESKQNIAYNDKLNLEKNTISNTFKPLESNLLLFPFFNVFSDIILYKFSRLCAKFIATYNVVFFLEYFNKLIVVLYLYIANNKGKKYCFFFLLLILSFNDNISFLGRILFILCLTFIFLLDLAYKFILFSLDNKNNTNIIKNIFYICILIFLLFAIFILTYYIVNQYLNTSIWPSNIDPQLNTDGGGGGGDDFNPNNQPNKNHYHSSASNSDNEEDNSESDSPLSDAPDEVAESKNNINKNPNQKNNEKFNRWYHKMSIEDKKELSKQKYAKTKAKETPEKAQLRKERQKANHIIRKQKRNSETMADRQRRKKHSAVISRESKRKARLLETPEQREIRLAKGRLYYQNKQSEKKKKDK